jgi:hypothetical protein
VFENTELSVNSRRHRLVGQAFCVPDPSTKGGEKVSGQGLRSERLTTATAAMPRSNPSSNVQALHKSLLDIYPHRRHVSSVILAATHGN